MGLIHLNKHRFNHNFQNCTCSLRTCTPIMCMQLRSRKRLLILLINFATLIELKSVVENVLKLSGNKLINLLLYGDPQFDSNNNTRLLNAAVKYIRDLGRFTVSLVQYRNKFILLFILFYHYYHYYYYYYYYQNMTKLFITLFSAVFIYTNSI